MAEDSAGYKDTPEEDRKRAKVFFDRGRTVYDTGNYEYAIEMYLQGIAKDPEAREAHETIREISLVRKARGGKAMGMSERWKLPKPAKEDFKAQMLNAEKQLAYDPGNLNHMVDLMVAAQKGGFFDTVLWIGNILNIAIAALDKPDINKYLALKDTYIKVERFKLAADACNAALRMRPQDMELQQELKDLSTREAIQRGNYESDRGFRESMRDREGQDKLRDTERDVRTEDSLSKAIREADEAFQADPTDRARFKRLIDALRSTSQTDHENRAIELLDKRFKETKNFEFRQQILAIAMTQLSRQERAMREERDKNPKDANLANQYKQFLRDRLEEELKMYGEIVDNYPTLSEARFEMGRRLFALGRFGDAIGVFQQVRNDPKYKSTAATFLGRSFLEDGFPDEAAETLEVVIADYLARGDEKSKEMTYWYARALEDKGDMPGALKSYSQVFQWQADYRAGDVRERIKRLRERLRGGGASAPTEARNP